MSTLVSSLLQCLARSEIDISSFLRDSVPLVSYDWGEKSVFWLSEGLSTLH